MRWKVTGGAYSQVKPDEDIDIAALPERIRRNLAALGVPRGIPDAEYERLSRAHPRPDGPAALPE